MIVAVYDNEPYAHMLPIHQVFDSIRDVYSHVGGSRDVEITLPPSPFVEVTEQNTLITECLT